MGIIVEDGRRRAWPAWDAADEGGRRARRRLTWVRRIGDERTFEWGMGTDDFLKPGADMEVFSADDYSDRHGAPGCAIAGIDGTAVARADFVSTSRRRSSRGRSAPGRSSPGDSIFYANVAGELARVGRVTTRTATCIEDHELRSCDDPVDCEVR